MEQLPPSVVILIMLLVIWTLPWKIYSLWLAAKHDHKKWFVAIVLLNTIGILEIFYIRKIAKKSWAEVKEDFRDAWNSFK
ncbi:MAG: hypothetical protein UR90_C0012G0004 [Parcubacteria group bacterium GW2011_GWC1_35_8]|uniref:DUF5652 domain-containing protein n=2 Tax=Candidatus Nomuraibacteriota TaxID=1752729 RepID=A0A1F6YVJ5_9BACT|nr:MAG: hypothetical protein UR90_C0012G0004 [Parcubacteria group bacterium GW2011_GWC1_35_8]KKP89324.1 MAG: Membrane protein [Candidatus Nomurabacteria bacterium GW2011_GWC2_35_8]OGJ04831.1 MAG: hypothetical protein A2238_02945 [Candidatus Nomurabacteria bacterium RIFOXYA2_FULL_35_9]OGJ10378.1 MAG: hypothetical protein A2456_02000 [Candidatus Nomurabacteria bacterium RIFOXYC2_FULL_36_19]OGJ14639.1 MAG: hypothetical protein A2554_02595 [Candidatus Nomurabacteria bacterium RIFOXYD2_FULL_35_12]